MSDSMRPRTSSLCPSCLSTTAQLTAAHALIAQWREEAYEADAMFKKDPALGRSLGVDVAASVTRRRADQLEALLTPQEAR